MIRTFRTLGGNYEAVFYKKNLYNALSEILQMSHMRGVEAQLNEAVLVRIEPESNL
jgi:hypothetical protein